MKADIVGHTWGLLARGVMAQEHVWLWCTPVAICGGAGAVHLKRKYQTDMQCMPDLASAGTSGWLVTATRRSWCSCRMS